MLSFGRLILAFIVSVLVAGLVATLLAIRINANAEFIAVWIALALFLIVGIVVFGMGALFSGERTTLTILALGLAGLVVAALAGVLALAASMHPADMTTLGTFTLSAFVGLLMQWLVVRRLFT